MKRYPRGYWKEESNILSAVQELYLTVGKDNFGYKALKENGPLENAIRRSNKTLAQYADGLNLEHNIVPKNYYKDINNINKEILLLVDKYGYYPSQEILAKENKSQINIALSKYFKKSLPQHLKDLGIPKLNSSTSKLELYIRNILNKLVDDTEYIDGGRKVLLDYGIDTRNPNTGRYLQIDRYYYNQKIAIEVQGQQHYRATSYWNETRVTPVKEVDAIKKKILEEQGVKLVYIRYNNIGIKTIYNQLKCVGINKLRELSETLYETILSQA